MDKFELGIWYREIERQCSSAIFAYSELGHAVNNLNNASYLQENELRIVSMNVIFHRIQSFLISAGLISKILWPDMKKYVERGKELRTNLTVTDSSLLKPRTFRNHFEHFDDRLEKWKISSNRRIMVDASVGDPSHLVGGDAVNPSTDFLRNFNPENFTLSFTGETYDIKAVADEITELALRTKKESSKS